MDPFAMGSALTQKGGLPQLIWRSQANLTVLSRSLAWIKREPQGCPGRNLSLKRIFIQVCGCDAKLSCPEDCLWNILDEGVSHARR